jgi:hypothetical protein
LGRDLKLKIKTGEVWGKAIWDLIDEYFSHLFVELGLCDVENIKLVLKWRNFISGSEGVSETLDRF